MKDTTLTERLITIYRNEKSTKTILPYDTTTINKLKTLLIKQEAYIRSIKKNSVIKNLYEQEIEQIKYFMKEYLKTRMEKIQNNFFIDRNFLSELENEYLLKLIEIYKSRNIYVETESDYKECVGFISKNDLGTLKIDNDDVEVNKKDFFVVPLADVQEYLYSDDIFLV